MSQAENLFTCALCGETYQKGRPEKDAMEEFRRDFPNVDKCYARVVCEDCYQLIKAKERQETA